MGAPDGRDELARGPFPGMPEAADGETIGGDPLLFDFWGSHRGLLGYSFQAIRTSVDFFSR